ncbi:MAG TPA: protein arginine kinase [Firmicutes bacterium]|nr:protein arginine kinase [Bacillota bacterium]
MSLQDAVNSILSQWMKGRGPEDEIVMGSRIRLARNIAKIPFPSAADDQQAAHVNELVRSVVESTDKLDWKYLSLIDMPRLDRELLVEKHLISPQQARDVKHKAVVLSRDEVVSIMVNEEDHLRIQCIHPGFQLESAWEQCDRVDDILGDKLEYAFSTDLGYLTACPTNVGTGLRASVMLHLPALAMTKQMAGLIPAVNKLGIAVRGLYGEGTESVGDIYQISNQLTLGHSEKEIIQHLATVARQVIDQEKGAREQLLKVGRAQLEDQCYRAYGVLSQARLISSQEAMQLVSLVWLGVDLGLVKEVDTQIVKSLVMLIRPAHLQKLIGRNMDAGERDVYRASLIREYLQTRQ